MAKLAFCDYHSMVAILEKTEHNTDFHQILDFLEASHIWKYTRRAIWIAQSKALSPAVDEPASLSRDDRQGEAFPTVSSLDAGQDRENIAKTSALPHESSPRVPSLDADEGSKSQVSRGQRKKKYRAYSRGCSNHKGIKDIREELGADKSTELRSNDTKEMVNVLSSMEATNILTSRGAAASVSPADVLPSAGVPTVSGSFPTPMRILIIGAKDKGKEKVIKTEVPKKRKLQEQIDAQVAREMEEEFAKENQRLSKQLARDSEIARLHAKEELKMMIEGLDRSNEVISKHLREYEQAESNLSLWTFVKETFSTKQATRNKEKELWVELKRLFEPDFEDQLWTHHQALMHDPLDWKLYDTCGVHHVSTKDQEIFMLVEKDYPLRKGLAIVMISNKLQVEQYSQMTSDLILKIHNIANSPR
nr:hypothetical protein [Tanacetum cinerariifolium]